MWDFLYLIAFFSQLVRILISSIIRIFIYYIQPGIRLRTKDMGQQTTRELRMCPIKSHRRKQTIHNNANVNVCLCFLFYFKSKCCWHYKLNWYFEQKWSFQRWLMQPINLINFPENHMKMGKKIEPRRCASPMRSQKSEMLKFSKCQIGLVFGLNKIKRTTQNTSGVHTFQVY